MKSKKMNRRKFIQSSAAAAGVAALSGCSALTTIAGRRGPDSVEVELKEDDRFDFVIVGSGAGGGPLAAGLARAGFRVMLLEAGSSKTNQLSQTPAFHAKASDDALLNWAYTVQRFSEQGGFKRFEYLNSKYQKSDKGVYYPRASGIGGCTRVNALINVYPDHQDWDHIANATGDSSWNSKDMFRLYNSMMKDSGGWLNLTQANPFLLASDPFFLRMVSSALALDYLDTTENVLKKIAKLEFDFASQLPPKSLNYLTLDPNRPSYLKNKFDGIFNMPFNATDGIRNGVREYVLSTQAQFPKNLIIKTESLCTRVLFDENNKSKAIGIEYVEGAHAYKADVQNQAKAPTSYVKKRAFAMKETILSGGAFNTPQLLMLSGVGPKQELEKFQIPVVKDLQGVGGNLQDRYEVTVVSELKSPLTILKDCTFARNNDFEHDPCWKEYLKNPSGHVYGTNGVALSLIRKSSSKQATPDLCIFGVPGFFKGYYPGYSNDATPKGPKDPSYFTWAVLKGHARNHAGQVKLRSSDPRETPEINFHYFHDQKNGMTEDMQAVFEGLQVARRLNDYIGDIYIQKEVYPGSDIKKPDDLASWIYQEAWGHHASCTSQMGRNENPSAVVDSKFRVHGLQGLRVVDASVFPDIPGLFIMLPTLMASEKAKETLLAEYRK